MTGAIAPVILLYVKICYTDFNRENAGHDPRFLLYFCVRRVLHTASNLWLERKNENSTTASLPLLIENGRFGV